MTDHPPTNGSEAEISTKARSVARLIDRLGPGEYVLTIERESSKASDWSIEIREVKKVKKIPA